MSDVQNQALIVCFRRLEALLSNGLARKTLRQIRTELLENVERAKTEFQDAAADDRAAARESYVRALDALNAFLRSGTEIFSWGCEIFSWDVDDGHDVSDTIAALFRFQCRAVSVSRQ